MATITKNGVTRDVPEGVANTLVMASGWKRVVDGGDIGERKPAPAGDGGRGAQRAIFRTHVGR